MQWGVIHRSEYLFCAVNIWRTKSSFSIIRKVSNIGIFVQLLAEINYKELRAESIAMRIDICYGALHSLEVTDFLILLIFKFKQNRNSNIANFVYYGNTRMGLTRTATVVLTL